MRRWLGRAAYWAAVLAVCLLAAELTARVDDWASDDTPLLAYPDRERDLVLKAPAVVRGRPNGHYKKFHLNEYGFRGPAMSLEPTPGRTRVMILGASEMFGVFESEGKEFGAQLQHDLDVDAHAEVVNAAMPGMTPRRMLQFWNGWAKQFRPQVVLIYAPCLMYLDVIPPSTWPMVVPPDKPLSLLARCRPRLLGRIGDLYHRLPQWAKYWREEWVIRQQVAGKSPDWFFGSVPQDRLDEFTADLAGLVAGIKASGARPILLTHANSSAAQPCPADFEIAHRMRMNYPRPTPEAMFAFERATADATRVLGKKDGVQVIDLAAALDGRRECFADLVHFTDDGAAVAARRVRAELPPPLSHEKRSAGKTAV